MNKASTNVFILGAGFSKAAGMPLLQDFVSRMRDLFEQTEGLSDKSYEAFKTVFAERAMLSQVREKVDINLDNIEQLFGLIDAVELHAPSVLTETEKAIRKAIGVTLLSSRKEKVYVNCQMNNRSALVLAQHGFLVEQPIDEFTKHPNSVSHIDIDPYLTFCLLVSRLLDNEPVDPNHPPEDIIISFNYDLVIEDSLVRIGAKADYQLEPLGVPRNGAQPGIVPLLKLHGSINWGYDKEKRIVTFADPNELIDDPDLYPVIVPPTWNKSGMLGQLTDVWNKAIWSLMRATRVFIIGYSMPKSDTFFEHFLAAGFLRNHYLRSLTVIDPATDRIKERLTPLLDETYFKDRLKYYSTGGRSGGFEDFMSWFEQTMRMTDRGNIIKED